MTVMSNNWNCVHLCSLFLDLAGLIITCNRKLFSSLSLESFWNWIFCSFDKHCILTMEAQLKQISHTLCWSAMFFSGKNKEEERLSLFCKSFQWDFWPVREQFALHSICLQHWSFIECCCVNTSKPWDRCNNHIILVPESKQSSQATCVKMPLTETLTPLSAVIFLLKTSLPSSLIIHYSEGNQRDMHLLLLISL